MMLKVTYREIENKEMKVEIMDKAQAGALAMDWAFEIINVEPIEAPKKKRFFFF